MPENFAVVSEEAVCQEGGAVAVGMGFGIGEFRDATGVRGMGFGNWELGPGRER